MIKLIFKMQENIFVTLGWGEGLSVQDPTSRSMRWGVTGRLGRIRKNFSPK